MSLAKTNLNAVEIVNALKGGKTPKGRLSNSDASWVAVRLAEQHGLEIGGPGKKGNWSGDEKTRGVLSALSKLSLAELEEYIENRLEKRAAKRAAYWAEVEAKEQARRAAMTDEEREAERAGMEEWWVTDGKYEEELEERGLVKDYHHALNTARQFERREPTAREFIEG